MSYVKSDFRVSEALFDAPCGAAGNWYAACGQYPTKYLHNDLELRGGCHHDDSWSGYYATERDARNAVDCFLAEQCVPGDVVQDWMDGAFSRLMLHNRLRLAEASFEDLEKAMRSLASELDHLRDRVSSIIQGDN